MWLFLTIDIWEVRMLDVHQAEHLKNSEYLFLGITEICLLKDTRRNAVCPCYWWYSPLYDIIILLMEWCQWLGSEDQFFFFFPNLFWIVMYSFFIPYSCMSILSSSSTKFPWMIISFPAFLPARFWTVELLANLSWSWCANPWICLTTYSSFTLAGINDYRPSTLVTFLFTTLSAISWIPLKAPYLNKLVSTWICWLHFLCLRGCNGWMRVSWSCWRDSLDPVWINSSSFCSSFTAIPLASFLLLLRDSLRTTRSQI